MNCKCGSERIAHLNAKCSDRCLVRLGRQSAEGYPPMDMGIGGNDHIQFHYCLDCGQMQGKFPLPPTELETNDQTGRSPGDVSAR